MNKSSNFKLNRLIFVITIIFTITITVGRGTILYQRTTSTTRGSELKIEVTPNSASFQPKKIYSYTFSLTAVKFGTNVDRFHEINVYVQFLNALEDISESKGYYEISTIGSPIQVVVDLIIPSKEILSLEAGDSLSGKLQIRVNFKEGVVLAIDPSYSTGWQTVADGKISLPPDYSTLIFFGGLGLIAIVVSFIIYYSTKSKKPVMEFTPPGIQAKPQLRAGMQFCPHCGKPTESAVFCSLCGGILK